MWIVRMGIGCAHNVAEQNERGIGETVFFQDRIERNVFAVMTELTLRHIEYDTAVDLVPLCVGWQKDKLRIRVHKLFDKPRAGNAVYFNFLASDPFHKLDSCFVAACSGTQSSPLFFTGRTKSLPSLQQTASAKAWADSLWKPRPHCRS